MNRLPTKPLPRSKVSTNLKRFTREEIDEWRLQQHRRKTIFHHDSMQELTSGDQQVFLQDLTKRWDNFHPNQFMHYFVYSEYETYFKMGVQKCAYTVMPYKCSCTTEGERDHVHYIVDTKNDNPNLKRLGTKLTRAVSGIMLAKNAVRNEKDKRVMYGRVIANASHLLNTIMYIQTEDTVGRHGGQTVDCKHRNHNVKDAIFGNKQAQAHFRKTVLYNALPAFKEEHERLWHGCKEKRKYKTQLKYLDAEEVDDDDIME